MIIIQHKLHMDVTKMADEDASYVSSDMLMPMMGVIEYHVENMLSRLNHEPLKDVLEDVLVLCSTDELREARDKLFVEAKKKVHADIKRAPSGSNCFDSVLDNVSEKICDPWGMVNRRSKKRLAEDVCKLYLFNCGNDYKFPSSLLKRGVIKMADNQRDIRVALRSVAKDHMSDNLERSSDGHPEHEDITEIGEKSDSIGKCDKKDDESGGVGQLHDGHYRAPDIEAGDHEPCGTPVVNRDELGAMNKDNRVDELADNPTNGMASLVVVQTLHKASRERLVTADIPDQSTEQTVPTGASCETETVYKSTSVQCAIVRVAALVLFPPETKVKLVFEPEDSDMASMHDASWDDLIEPEQVPAPVQHNEPGSDDEAARDDLDDVEHLLVERAEFDTHVEYTERTMNEVEQKFNALDSWNAQFEHRIDIVDTVLHEKMRLLKIRQSEADNEINQVRRLLNDFIKGMDKLDAQLPNRGGDARQAPNESPRKQSAKMEQAAASKDHNNVGPKPARPLPQRQQKERKRLPKQATPLPANDATNVRRPLPRPKLRPGVIERTPCPTSTGGKSASAGGMGCVEEPETTMEVKGNQQTTSQRHNGTARPTSRDNQRSANETSEGNNKDTAVEAIAHGGARPKTAPKGKNFRSSQSDKATIDVDAVMTSPESVPDSEYQAESYASKASKFSWDIATNKKRKRERSGYTPQKPVRRIKGFSNKTNKEFSVQGLSNDGFESLKEIEDSVTAYCQESGVNLIFVRVFPRKHELMTVGCKIAVSEEDATRVARYEFWPDDVHAHVWHPGNKNRRDDDKAGEFGPDRA